MDLTKLRNSPVGRLVAITGIDPRTGVQFDHFAFVPEPLPEVLELAQETWTAVAKAMESLGRLSQACSQLPNPRLLIAPALMKEAVDTSALEGTYGALPEVLEARLSHLAPPSPEVREIVAYQDMATLAFSWVEDRPITTGMLCDLQRVLADGSRKRPRDIGKLRTHQVIIGPEHASVYDARFVPPPDGDMLRAGVDSWEAWVRTDHGLPVVVRAAMAHYQFECLHPFADGNGRIGRLLIVLQLLNEGTLVAPSLTISPWLLRRRTEYQDHLLEISRTGDWNPWIAFICQALQDQCAAHVAVAQRLLDWVNDLRQKLHDRRWGGVVARLSEDLIDWPIVDTRWVMDKYDVSRPTAKHAIDRLVEIEVLYEMTGKAYRRVYGAKRVMQLVESL
jgi:Fic family protein